jgi:hypothetical protein
MTIKKKTTSTNRRHFSIFIGNLPSKSVPDTALRKEEH